MAKRKTHDKFIEELKDINPEIKVLEKYINSRTKLKCLCLKCGNEWSAKPDSLLSKHGCPVCNSKHKTNEQFREELFLKRPEIELLSDYVNNKTKVKIRHLDCGHVEYKLPTDLICQYRGCYLCYKRAKISDAEFKSRVKIMNPHIEVIGNYVNAQTNVLCKCLRDGHEWLASPYYLTHNSDVCPKCSGIAKITKDDANNRLKDRGLVLLEDCDGNHKKYNFYCVRCSKSFTSELNSVLSHNAGCPVCNKSIGEKKIEDFLIANGIRYFSQYKFSDLLGVKGRQLSYDFYIPSHNLLVEYQGKQHYAAIEYFGGDKNFKIQQEHDKRKREYAELHSFDLLEIKYVDFKQVIQILSQKLNICNNEKSA